MRPLIRLPEQTSFRYMKFHVLAFALSAAATLGTFALLWGKGLNLGVDFTGGTLIELRVPDSAPDLADIRNRLNDLGLGSISIQEFGQPQDLLIRLPQQEGGAQEQRQAVEKLRAALTEKYEAEGVVDIRREEFVGPQVGQELKQQALYAILFSLLGILAYVWFRFEWQFGVAALISLFHDVIATIGLFAVTGMQFDLTGLAAVLMIAGYSINDTVVIFDRIRDNLQKYKKMPLADLFDLSLNQTLSRTILTGCTTLLALISLWWFGGEVISGFTLTLFFGVIFGTYSSLFIAAPLLLYLRPRQHGVQNGEQEAQASA